MALVQNFNVNPYYDDYDEDKKFLRMLFRPGYSVQARELTQLQTILQKQVERFGNHIFTSGSTVSGAEIQISTSRVYHKLETTTSAGNAIDVNNFLGKTIGNAHALASGGGLGKVIAVFEAEGSDPPTIIVSYTTGLELVDGETFFTIDDDLFEARLVSSSSSGKCSVCQVGEGILYIEGFFVKINPQTLVLDKYTNDSTYRVGIQYDEYIVDSASDTSLLDPALNASNYQAPGANRYKVELTLAKRLINSTDDTKFFEFKRIINGETTKTRDSTIYSDLLNYMAERTYDESGNYTVNPFKIYLKDHVPAIGGTSDETKFTAKLSEGHAYVRGYSVGKKSSTNLTIDKARDVQSVQNYNINTPYGNYLTVANTKGLFDISEMATYDLHIVQPQQLELANTRTYENSKIGTTRIREIEYDSAVDTTNGETHKHRLYLFDTRFIPFTGNPVAATTNSITLPLNGYSSAVTNAYVGATIRISAGTGADNVKHTITSYAPVTRIATIEDNFSTTPTSGSTFVIDYNIKDIESVAKINAAVKIISSANVANANKVDSLASGDTFYSETDGKGLVFRVPQSFVEFGMTDKQFRGKYVWKNVQVTSGLASISTGSISATNLTNRAFVGTGGLSDSVKREHFIVTANTMGAATAFTNGELIPMDSSLTRNISVSPSTTASFNFNTSQNFTVDIVATVDFNSAEQKTKTLVTANTTVVGPGTSYSVGGSTVYPDDGQIAIPTPNKIPGSSDSLYTSDIFKLEGKFQEEYGYFSTITGGITKRSSFRVIDSLNISNPVSNADLSDTSKDITDRYILNDGQRDEYYDHGSITLRPGFPPPTGQILVLFNYFDHGSGTTGYFNLDSYNQNTSLDSVESVRYAKIPLFRSPTSGKTYKLRDCIDFRPRRTDRDTSIPNFELTGISIPKSGESLDCDYSYYLPRIDRIVIRDDLKFDVIRGIPAITPQTPNEPPNAMTLYTLSVFPFTFFPTVDTQVKYVENKRYTMRDIGKLEKRISNLEYYTSLNTLEKSTQDLTVLDSNGLERFKNGILVDAFRGHQVGDVTNLDYKCSINAKGGELRPSFTQKGYNFQVNTSISTVTTHSGVISSPAYTIQPLIEQNIASKSLSVNPFTLNNYIGTIKFWPAGDFWIDTETRPDVLINLDGENDAWEAIGAAFEDLRPAGFEQNWDPWSANFAGKYQEDTVTTTQDYSEGYLDYQDTIETTYGIQYYSRERTGTQNTIVPERVYADIGRRQVDLSVIPYIREQYIYAKVTGLKPNIYHYIYGEQGDDDDTKYFEHPSVAWLYDVNGIFNDKYGIFEEVTSSSGGTARVMKASTRSWSLESPFIYLSDVRGDWNLNDTITGSVSGSTAKIDVMFWNNGNVISSGANTLEMGSGAPYDDLYVDVPAEYAGLTFNSGSKTLEDAKTVNEFYNVRIISGTGIGQQRTITAYNGTTKVATLDSNWDVQPDSTSRWSVGRLQSDDHGECHGRWFLPNYSPTTYDNGRRYLTGTRLIRFTDSYLNNPLACSSMAEENWIAQGVLNTVENVTVSVRVPTIVPVQIYDLEENYTYESSVVDTEVVGTVLVKDRTPPPPSAGSGCKIICAQMSDLGFFSPEINDADQRFGRRLQRRFPRIYNGYVYWAKTIVDWNKGKGPNLYLWDMKDNGEMQKNISLYMTQELARPWSQEMAKLEGVKTNTSITGKFIFWFGFLISALVGLFKPDITKSDSKLKGYTILTIMLTMFTAIKFVKLIGKPFGFLKNLKQKLIRN